MKRYDYMKEVDANLGDRVAIVVESVQLLAVGFLGDECFINDRYWVLIDNKPPEKGVVLLIECIDFDPEYSNTPAWSIVKEDT